MSDEYGLGWDTALHYAHIAAALVVRLGGRVELTHEECEGATVLRIEPIRERAAFALVAEANEPSERA